MQASFIRTVTTLIVAMLTIAGCGGSSGNGGTSPPPPTGPNTSPTISGNPDTFLYSGQAFDFVPVANDPDNDPLKFSITGLPRWGSFNNSTGRLQGAPGVGDAGSYDGITISVSDGRATSSLAPFSIVVEAFAPSGLASRPSNLSCLAVSPPTSADITLQRMYSDLDLDDVTALVQAPGDSSAWYFTTRDGLIGRFDNDQDVSAFTTVLDHTNTVLPLADGGLISMIFHWNYPDDRRVFVNYSVSTSDSNFFGDIIISSFRVSTNGRSINPSSEVRLLRQPRGEFHQGGFMSFDDDGMLLFALGDGTRQRDPDGNAQNLSDYRGKMHRVDVDSGSPYRIPSDNPYAANGGSILEEIYAHGLRNPYAGDIDPDTGRIFVGDVGLASREEVSEVFSGSNLGWNIKQGTRCYSEQYGSCSDPTLTDPLVEYSHSDGNCAVIGGYFYRGSLIPELQGRFLFADFCTSKISAVEFDNDGDPFEKSLIPAGSGLGRVTSFAKDNDGELYAVTGSQIHKILPNNSSTNPTGPADQLSQTGCFDSNNPSVPAPGLIPYDLQVALWSDAATKQRWMAIPDGRTIDVAADGDFLFPEGTVLVKEFSIDGQRIETRLLMKDENEVWNGYSYEWIGNDAFLLPAGKQKTLTNGQTWQFPSRGECNRCHTDLANISLGPEIGQLNGHMTYPETNLTSNQLATLDSIGMFTNGLPDTPDQLPALAGLDDTHHATARRARGYLHSNCSGCHRGEGPTQSNMDLRFSTNRTDMNVCNASPSFGDLGINGAMILTPGDPARSILVQRPSSTNPLERMPPLGTTIVHAGAIGALSNWISSTSVCAIESDSDLDQVPDDVDNCPNDSNPDQSDLDRDQVGDVCDAN
jgi:uncharacterized repeat protein (TIGR03806 family)